MKNRLSLLSVSPGNKSLEFLEKRISLIDYRGVQVSQHNRYNIDKVCVVLEEIYNFVQKNKMTIRNTDLSKRPRNTPEESIYAQFTDKVSSRLEHSTQDSIRKNLFVDFHRMGFINRYDKNGQSISPRSRKSVKYVSLTDSGYKLINEENVFTKRMIYSKGINRLMSDYLNELLHIVLELDYVTDIEHIFFVSFLGYSLDSHTYDRNDVVSLVKTYRRLSRIQKKQIEDTVKQFMKPSNFSHGNKKNKKDFHNWKNETDQIFMLLDQTVYFEVNDGVVRPRVGNEGIFDSEVKLDRSKKEKDIYFKYHKLNKTKGYELHHIVPLMWAENRDQWLIIDNHKNMIYIDGYSHSVITQNRNRNVILSILQNDDMVFKDYNDPYGTGIICKKGKNVLYDKTHKDELLKYNVSLLKSCIE